jgi:hypothetical protein
LPGGKAFFFERFPKLPFLSADRFKASDGLSTAGKIRDGRVTFWSNRHATSEPIGQAKKVQSGSNQRSETVKRG